MTTRVTLRLPEHIYERLCRAGRGTGRSLNQVIVDALDDADLTPKPPEGLTPQELVHWALKGITVEWTDELDREMGKVFDVDLYDEPVLTHEELWEKLPKLPPEQWLSRAVIEDREDRI